VCWERARLKQLLMSIKPKNFGVIVRTVAEGKRVAELDGELRVVEEVAQQTYGATGFFINQRRILGGFLYFSHCIFPMFEIKDYVSLIAPDRANIVKLYKGQLPIYDNFGITKTYGATGFFINQRRILGGFLYFSHCIFPMFNQDSKLSMTRFLFRKKLNRAKNAPA